MSAPAYFPFFPTDFLEGTRDMPAELVGVYIKLLCAMYQQDGSIKDDSRAICRLTCVAPQKWPRIRAALIAMGKLSIPEPGRLSNGRCIAEIMRQKARVEARREGQSRGGLTSAARRAQAAEHPPAIVEPAGLPPPVTHRVTLEVAPDRPLNSAKRDAVDSGLKTQGVQILPPSTQSESQTGSPGEQVSAPPKSAADAPSVSVPAIIENGKVTLTPKDIVAAWNAMAEETGLPKVEKLSDERRMKLRQRVKEVGPDGVMRAIRMIGESAFCRGQNKQGWQASFDFMLQKSSLLKVLEGNFANRRRVSLGHAVLWGSPSDARQPVTPPVLLGVFGR